MSESGQELKEGEAMSKGHNTMFKEGSEVGGRDLTEALRCDCEPATTALRRRPHGAAVSVCLWCWQARAGSS